MVWLSVQSMSHKAVCSWHRITRRSFGSTWKWKETIIPSTTTILDTWFVLVIAKLSECDREKSKNPLETRIIGEYVQNKVRLVWLRVRFWRRRGTNSLFVVGKWRKRLNEQRQLWSPGGHRTKGRDGKKESLMVFKDLKVHRFIFLMAVKSFVCVTQLRFAMLTLTSWTSPTHEDEEYERGNEGERNVICGEKGRRMEPLTS